MNKKNTICIFLYTLFFLHIFFPYAEFSTPLHLQLVLPPPGPAILIYYAPALMQKVAKMKIWQRPGGLEIVSLIKVIWLIFPLYKPFFGTYF